jgi:hypothetical protein
MTQPDNAAEVQEQLKVLLALIEDARSEIASDPRSLVRLRGSAELNDHLLTVGMSLDELERIIERRLKGHDEKSDSAMWTELVVKVVSRQKQIRELVPVLGSGQKLARLAERLPHQLPGAHATAIAEAERGNAEKTSDAQGRFTNRRAMVDDYIEEVRLNTRKRIKRKDIWSYAGYDTRTEFERWERQDSKRPNKAAHERFTHILCVEKPHLK